MRNICNNKQHNDPGAKQVGFQILTDLFSEPLVIASMEPIPRYFFSLTPSWKKYSPGASSVPASNDPHICKFPQYFTTTARYHRPDKLTTAEAPKQSALMMCPDEAMPPSAMQGTPYLLASLLTL
jgi:hypothetical protein